MAQIERIDSLYDVQAISQENEALMNQLRSILVVMNDVQKGITATSGAKGGSGLAAETQKLTKAQQELQKELLLTEKITQQKLKTEQEVIKTMQQEEKTEREQLKTKQAKDKASDAAAKATDRETIAAEKLDSAYNQLNARARIATTIANEMGAKYGLASEEFKSASERAKAMNVELYNIDAASARYTRNVGNYSSAFTGYATTLRGLRGPTKLLGEALGIGAQEADQFRLVLEHSFQAIAAFFKGKEAKAAATTADTAATGANTAATTFNTDVTKTNTRTTFVQIEATEGAAVAQTELAVATTATSTAMKVLRIAMLATGIGIVIGLIALLVANWDKVRESLGFASEAQKAYNDTLEDYQKGAAEAIVKVDKVKVAFDEAKAGVIGKDDALKVYNETLGDSLGKTNSLAEAEKLYNAKAGAYIQIMGLKAQANALFAKSAEEAAKGLVAGQDDNVNWFEKLFTASTTLGTGLIKAQVDNTTDIIDTANKKSKTLFGEAEKLAFQADGLAKKLDIKTDTTADKKPKTVNKDYLDDVLKAQLEQQKLILQAQIDFAKEQVDAENNTLTARLMFLDIFYKKNIELLGVNRDNEIKINLEKTAHELQQAGLTRKQKAEIIEAGELERKNIVLKYMSDARKAQLAFDAEDIKLRQEKEKKLEAIGDPSKRKTFLQNEEAELKYSLEQQLLETSYYSLQEQKALTERYAAGKISREDYEKGILKIQREYAEVALDEQIASLKKQADVIADPKQKAAALQKITELETQLNLLFGKDFEDKTADKFKGIIKGIDKTISAFKSARDIIAGFISASAENEKNAIADKEEAEQKNYDAEVQRINDSTLTEQDKDDRLKELEEQRRVQKEANDRKAKDADQKKAKFDKASAIALIVLETAKAVVHELATGDPFTAFARAAIAGAIGAAQLAVAIATPLPHYAVGIDNAPEGMAVVGERGAEGRVEPDGSFSLTPDKPTLTYLRKGTKIVAHHRLADYLPQVALANMPRYNASMSDTSMGEFTSTVTDAIHTQTAEIKKLNRRKTKVINNIRIDAGWNNYLVKKVYSQSK